MNYFSIVVNITVATGLEFLCYHGMAVLSTVTLIIISVTDLLMATMTVYDIYYS